MPAAAFQGASVRSTAQVGQAGFGPRLRGVAANMLSDTQRRLYFTMQERKTVWKQNICHTVLADIVLYVRVCVCVDHLERCKTSIFLYRGF